MMEFRSLDIKIDDCNLSVRAKNCLMNAQIETIRDLIGRKEKDVLKLKNMGRKSLREIKALLKDEFDTSLDAYIPGPYILSKAEKALDDAWERNSY